MRQIRIIAKRELGAYFATPMAFVFIAIFVALTGAFTFFIGRFFDRNQASLETFFQFMPWLYLLLVPAVAMRLWAEERKSGSIELLMTLPITRLEAVAGKFLAAYGFAPRVEGYGLENVGVELTERGATNVTVIEKGTLPSPGGSTSHAPGLVQKVTSNKTLAIMADQTINKLLTVEHEQGPSAGSVLGNRLSADSTSTTGTSSC